ncbi:MAG: translation initiation factor IF-2 [candidate division Zixibacteria bacterium]|nr:translation initiation factor IF-2 [candidate division Zixibacteria bacterium]
MPGKSKRIYELAKEYKISSNAMLTILEELKFEPKSHMSVATPEMVEAVEKKFAVEKQEAKKDMKQKIQAKAKVPAVQGQGPVSDASVVTSSGGIKVKDSTDKLSSVLRRIEKKKKKKERRRKKGRREVDKAEVARAFKATMAGISGGKARRKYRRGGSEFDEADNHDSNVIEINEYMSVAELAKLMDVKPVDVIGKLMGMGAMATINQRLDMDTIQMVASEFGFETREVGDIGDEAREDEHEDQLELRAPVVTVMGHVDHGKTSLLDYIRHTNVVAGEAGAITQHIGAYEVHHNDQRIVFLDTPGHEAFTAMRARGTQITDIVILVVAADESVMPQTLEAIDHARAANVPIIVAINKIDKPNANPDNVRTQLSQHNLLDESWGGKTIMVEVSAKSGQGIDRLLDMVLLQAELLELKADPGIRGQGVIVDSRLERGRGPVATVLIQRGTCAIGDPIVAGMYSGRIRTMVNDREEKMEIIGPSTPAQITGLSGVPQAGDSFLVVHDDQEAREITLRRSQIKREYEHRRPQGAVTLEKVFDQIREGQIRELRLIIKGDVDGSVEVLSDTLGKIATDEVKTHIIRSGVGAVTESDVLLAAASDAVIIGFQVAPDTRARELARTEKVDIRQYSIIYEAESDIRKALEGLLSPTVSENLVGSAEVRNTFRVPKVGLIAGCYVKEGRINRKDRIKLVRDGKIVYSGSIGSLRRFKDDAREVKEGYECGIGIENFQDVKLGDVIEAYELVETARTLQS